jgi:23S rRNA U2552 (ribose-2'-O)-methylase RlmE/FtsJ
MGLAAQVGAAVAALPSLGISEDLATDLRNFLTTSAGELTDSTPDQTGTTAFGSSPASQQCSSDAHKARTHVAKAILDMSAALNGYDVVVTDLYRNVTAVDDTAHVDLVKLSAQADACVAPSFAAPSSCTLPGNSSEGS